MCLSPVCAVSSFTVQVTNDRPSLSVHTLNLILTHVVMYSSFAYSRWRCVIDIQRSNHKNEASPVPVGVA